MQIIGSFILLYIKSGNSYNAISSRELHKHYNYKNIIYIYLQIHRKARAFLQKATYKY